MGEYFENQETKWSLEENAYNKEIDLANAEVNTQLAKDLENLKQMEYDRIYGNLDE